MNYVLRRKGVGEKIGAFEEFSQTGLRVIRSDHELPTGDFVFRWGTTSTIPGNPRVINKASAIHKVYDKKEFRLLLSEHDLSPKSYGTFVECFDLHYDHDNVKYLVRPKTHIRSQDMVVCSNIKEIYTATERFKDGYYISDLIDKKAEYRVFIVSGRVVAVVRKIPSDPTAISWGCVDSGTFEYVAWTEWPLEATRKAVQAFQLSGLDFGAIDVISDSKRSYVLEINTAPELTNYYMKTFVKAFDYIVQNGSDHISVDLSSDDFKDYIHPAISSTARI